MFGKCCSYKYATNSIKKETMHEKKKLFFLTDSCFKGQFFRLFAHVAFRKSAVIPGYTEGVEVGQLCQACQGADKVV